MEWFKYSIQWVKLQESVFLFDDLLTTDAEIAVCKYMQTGVDSIFKWVELH